MDIYAHFDFSIITHPVLEIRRRQLDGDSVKVELKKKLYEHQQTRTQIEAISSPPMHVSLHYMYDLTIHKHARDVALLLSSLLSIFQRFFIPRIYSGLCFIKFVYNTVYIPMRSVVWLFYYRWLYSRNSYACLFYWYDGPAPVSRTRNGF